MQYSDVMQSLKQVGVSHNLTPEEKQMLQKEAGAIFVGTIRSIQEAPTDTKLQAKELTDLKALEKNIQTGLTGKKQQQVQQTMK